MTTEPTYAELDSIDMNAKAIANQNPIGTPFAWRKAYLSEFARAVLAKWGTSAGAGVSSGRVASANCQYATVEWLQQTSEIGGGDPDNSRSWPITGDSVYLAPQPTQVVDSALEDAERYRWLFGARTEAQAASVSETVFKPLPQDEVLSHLQGFYMSKTDVDALVDAARKQGGAT